MCTNNPNPLVDSPPPVTIQYTLFTQSPRSIPNKSQWTRRSLTHTVACPALRLPAPGCSGHVPTLFAGLWMHAPSQRGLDVGDKMSRNHLDNLNGEMSAVGLAVIDGRSQAEARKGRMGLRHVGHVPRAMVISHSKLRKRGTAPHHNHDACSGFRPKVVVVRHFRGEVAREGG
ncbi:hypothetical protein BJV78DRAFT_1156877 [Lactifluus subvellereus]|nr:hypothetical protein BJV78DRAFT_1156877 [Lactifluus subvellereus]